MSSKSLNISELSISLFRAIPSFVLKPSTVSLVDSLVGLSVSRSVGGCSMCCWCVSDCSMIVGCGPLGLSVVCGCHSLSVGCGPLVFFSV